MSASLTPTRSLARAWKSLGAPRARSALALGPQGFELARAVREAPGADDVLLLHPEPPPARSRFRTTSVELEHLARTDAGSFGLVAVGGGLEEGELWEIRRRVHALAAVLEPGGFLAATVDAMAAPGPDATARDHLLFPQLARSGHLGEALQARALLPPSAWRALLQGAGFEMVAMQGCRDQVLPPDLVELHERRLAAYDAGELAGGALRLVARKTGVTK